jgi:small subunit ribosomal protein S20
LEEDLANIRSAIKRNRQNEKRRLHNRIFRGSTRTQIRKARNSIISGDEKSAAEEVKRAIAQLDRAAAKGIIHKNNAARRKSRLMAQLNSLAK